MHFLRRMMAWPFYPTMSSFHRQPAMGLTKRLQSRWDVELKGKQVIYDEAMSMKYETTFQPPKNRVCLL